MKRFALEKLRKWRQRVDRKPLILNGARQVGKTWLLNEFGKNAFRNIAYIAFDGNPAMSDFFRAGYSDINRLIMGIQADTGVTVLPQETLIVFDEIQLCPEALTSLKYWQEKAPEYAVVAAGSLLGLELQSGTGYPVGKTQSLQLYPMCFGEFLCAVGEEKLWELVDSGDRSLLAAFAGRLKELLRLYIYVGGMPAAVEAFAKSRNPIDAREIQSQILIDYDRDFAKHVPKNQLPRIRALWRSLPKHLAKEDKRFVATEVEGIRHARDLHNPFMWLEGAGLGYRVWNVTKPNIPLASYQNHLFKFFGVDIGLLSAQANISSRAILEGDRLFAEFNGALTEQYVQQELRASCGLSPYFWARPDSQAEMDFLVECEAGIVPIEAKARCNLKAKSLSLYRSKFAPALAVRTSLADYRREGGLVDLPLFELSTLSTEIFGSKFK